MEQIVRFPGEGLQDSRPGQSSTATQWALERISERIVEQIADIPVSRGSPHRFAQDRVHPLHRTFQLVFLKTQMSLRKVLFALFPKFKKVRRQQPSRVRACPPVSAHGLGRAYEAADEARREARRQETLRLAADALDRVDKLTKRRKKRKKNKLPRCPFSRGSLVVDTGSGLLQAVFLAGLSFQASWGVWT